MDPKNSGNEMPKAFESQQFEEKIYAMWEEKDLFKPETLEKILKERNMEAKSPFTMTLPPPNANGQLHLGHTCGYSFQDAMGRYNRMHGHPTLLLPGKDHASIQTEAVFTKILNEQGVDKWELGRDEFYRQCYEFCMNAAADAQEQEKKVGLSADWSRDFFTLDPRLTEVIYETFFKMLDDGLVYRGKYLINQCPHCRTALADVDTVREERRGIMAYFTYPFVEESDNELAVELLGQRGIMVATTRPETMLGDTAVAVNPKDERYLQFVGKKVRVPFVDREITIITDDGIDPEGGTGAVKVTPAHSVIDFEIGEKNDLEIINVIDENGLMSGEIPERFKGMETVDCSKALVGELKELGLLDRVEGYKHEVVVCERCSTPIQPIISNQWFVNVKPLADRALEALDRGDTVITPEGQEAALRHFFKNIKPWCISRQLWWGQRIPVWYSGGKKLYDWLQNNPGKTVADWEVESGEKARGSGTLLKGLDLPDGDQNWKGDPADLWLEQEEDIFDTWFSSGQWPYSTLGGPGGEDFAKFYPTQVMETARDILFWWVARMMMMGLYSTGEVPFAKVFLHGLIMAEDGNKMSKSKGNGRTPGEMFEKYGADALRLWYYTDSLPGSNTPTQEDKIKGHRNFVNKVWNASRFIMMNIDDSERAKVADMIKVVEERFKAGDFADSKKLERLNDYITEYRKHMEGMKFHLAAEGMREFFWGEVCDKWIEESKAAVAGEEIGSAKRIAELGELLFILKSGLKVMHPMMPYITEAIWQELGKIGLAQGELIVEQW